MSTSESDNPLSDYMDEQIKEAATRVASDERTVITKTNVYFNFSFTDYMKAGCGLSLGVLAAIGMAAFAVDAIKYVKQLLGM